MRSSALLLATLAGLIAVPALAQPALPFDARSGDCFVRAPANNSDGYVWIPAPCGDPAPMQTPAPMGPPDAGFPDGLAGGPPPAPPLDAPPAAYAPPAAAYDPNRAPFYAGNITAGGGYMGGQAPLPPPPADLAPPAADLPQPPAPPYPPAPYAYGPPPMPAYGPPACTASGGPLPGGDWRRQDCQGGYSTDDAYGAYPPPSYPPPAYQGAPYSPPAYAAGPPPIAPGGFGPGQCASQSGSLAGGRVRYESQSCERASSRAYVYASGSASGYPAPDAAPHWPTAGRDPDGFLTWPGKVGF